MEAHMTKPRILAAALVLSVAGCCVGSDVALAQQGPARRTPMTFFVTSVPIGDGGNLGGLAGADAHCQALATKAGRGNVKWVAYMSTQGPGAVNARDRIGNGPWHNARGLMIAMNQDELHGDTIQMARQSNRVNKNTARTETGELVKGVGDMPNEHDMLTGSTLEGRAYTDGMDHTCSNWTSGADGMGSAQVGHHDKIGNGSGSWNSAHASRGCSQPNLVATGGAGLFLCFAPGN
jgi:hypothetical protein